MLRDASGPFGFADGAAEVLRLKSAAVTRGVRYRASVLQRTRSRAHVYYLVSLFDSSFPAVPDRVAKERERERCEIVRTTIATVTRVLEFIVIECSACGVRESERFREIGEESFVAKSSVANKRESLRDIPCIPDIPRERATCSPKCAPFNF